MALSMSDERTLLLPLLDGGEEPLPWQSFLGRLAQRTGAAFAMLVIRSGGPSFVQDMMRVAWRPGLAERHREWPDVAEIEAILPLSALRPGRVYALDEFVMAAAAQPATPAKIADARIIRVDCGGGLDAWLGMADERISFSAVDSALLSSLASFIAHAIRAWADRLGLQMRLVLADSLLSRLGVGRSQLDSSGRILAADPKPRPSGEAPALRMSQAAPHNGTAWASTSLWRAPMAGRDDAIIAALRDLHGLSAREAALAWAIAQGEPLPDAGARLGLTRETARNYSKRIYLKTGTSGQADLARLCHTSVAVLI